MYQFFQKNGQLFAFLLGVILIVLFLIMAVPKAAGVNFADMADEEIAGVSYFNFGLWAAIFLVIACVVLIVVFGLIHLLGDLKGSIKGLIGFGLLLVLFFIAYSMASGDPTPYIQGAIDKFDGTISSGQLKFIGGGIGTAVALIALAFVAFIVMEIINFFK